jgi:perosamine synthetase
MSLPMIPLAVPDLTGNEANYLAECVRSTFVSSVGAFVGRFEAGLAERAGAAGAVATCSGTTALHLMLHVAGVKPGDLVVLPTLTFIASANAIAHCGATPWLFDVNSASWTLDSAGVASAFARDVAKENGHAIHRPTGRRVAAILAVHTLGAPCDMDALAEVARIYDVPLLADAAAALGATYKGRPLAAMGAAMSAISFNGNKTITCGGGGAIVAADSALLAHARHLGATARVGADYDHDEIGFNYRMTNVEAAIGCAQIERLDAFLAAKRVIRTRYNAAFADRTDMSGFPECPWGESACWFSGAVLAPEAASRMPVIRARLRKCGIDARPFWKPMHLQAPYALAPREATPIADALWLRVLTLPCSVALTQTDQARVIAETFDAVEVRT